MTKQLRYLCTLLLCMIASVGWADVLFYTLTPTTNSAQKSSSYSDSYDFTINGITWSVKGNTSMNPWRIGGKSLNGVDRTAYSRTAMGSAITKVDLTVGEASSITVNSLKLIVASDAAFTNTIDEVSATFDANSKITFTPTSTVGIKWAKSAYYKFVFNVTVSGSSNKFVEFMKAEFYSAEDDTRTAVNMTDFTALSTTLIKGTTTTTAVTNDQIGWTPSYIYTSSKESVATIDNDGVITAVSKGVATITAALNIASNDENYKAGETTSKTIDITVNNPSHIASFSINGETLTNVVEEGTAITFPSDIADISGKSFVGWTAEAIDGITEAAPSFINSATMGENDVTFFAVFATKAEGNYTTTEDVLNRATTGVTSTSYTSWANKKASSDAIYAGNSAGGNTSIQLRSDNSTSGIITTTSGGKVKNVAVTWESNTTNGRKLNIYGSNTAYTAASDLYNSSKQGTLLGTMTYDANTNHITELSVTDDYEYIGLRSASGAMYLINVSITWASGTPDTYSAYCTTVVADNRQEANISFEVAAVEKELKSSYTGEVLKNPNTLQVTYSSSDESVATVSSEGVVTILAEGETIINAAFKGNDDYKPANANYKLTVIDSRGDANPTFASESVTVMIAETIDAPALTKDGEGVVTYSTSDATIATVDDASGVVTGVAVGTATITATVAETNSYKGGTATFTVTVKDPNVLSATFNFDNDYEELFPNLKGGLSSGNYNEETYDDSGDFKTVQTATKEGIDLTVSPAEEGKAPNRLWDGTPRLRMYSGSLTISAPSASKIKVITFTGHNTNFDITPSVGTLNEKVWEGEAETVVFTVNKNTQIGTIEVAYVTSEPIVEPSTPVEITEGFYTIKNLGNEQFVNVAGRKTVTFVDETATAPGTVIKVESNENGQVQVLRSQGVDLPGYAERAMKYVPKIVQLVAEKLGAEGEGNLLGKDGLGKIMDKFNESFDYHLYTEQGEQGVRIYGKTPSMQPVVDFYNENQANVDAKLPMLEDFINSAIRKVLDKTGGSGASILTEFSLHEIWEKMGKTLTEPLDANSKLEFLKGVLSNKQYVWDFAYQTAMKYWKPLISHEKVQQNLSELGDLAQYVEKIEYIRPDVKYYIVQKNGKIDFISQDNTLLKEASSEWELAERKKFTVNFDEQNVQKGKYYTTLYTDFAYTLPEGVKAMTVAKVAELNGKNIAITETIKGAVPAQTPVLLESATAGNVELTLDVTDGTAIENLLKGNDWLVNKLEITTPQVDKLFGIVHDLLKYENMESLYDRYVKEYEYLKKRNAGTVNNKYFFGLSGDDIAEASMNICQFTKDEQGLAFSHYLEQSAANKAFLPGDKDLVYLSFVGDVDRDGDVDKDDLSALIKIILGTNTEEDNYDYDAANVNEDENEIPDIADVTALVNILK